MIPMATQMTEIAIIPEARIAEGKRSILPVSINQNVQVCLHILKHGSDYKAFPLTLLTNNSGPGRFSHEGHSIR
jgi:hypothetical protein